MSKDNQPTAHNPFVDQLSFYQSANSDNDFIKKNFVIRVAEFELIIEAMRSKKNGDAPQHELILGRRGSGKSTLLRRIQAEVEEDEELKKKYIAINLAEEQAAIYRLSDLWLEVINELTEKLDANIKLKEFSSFKSDAEYCRYLYNEIHTSLTKHKRKAVLLLDNFDRIVGNFSDDGHLLREILLNYNDIQLIAGSTRMDEHFWQYDKPFYEFFRRHRLEALPTSEIIELLNHWATAMNLPQLAEFAKKNIGKIETVRILTDGLPRTLQFFIEILLHNSELYGYEYLKKIMDSVTTLYQERLNTLPASHRKIVAEMAFIWEACTTKELVEKCRMESRLVSAYIKQLSNVGIVETINTDTKNHLYRIAERFFNMWLIVTQGNPTQKRQAKWLSIFLETWYDAPELNSLACEHLEKLRTKKISYDKAIVFTKAFTQSRYITTTQRDELIDSTRALQKEHQSNTMLELPAKFGDMNNEIIRLVDENKFEAALKKADQIENEQDGMKFFIKGVIFEQDAQKELAEMNYLLAIEKDHADAMFNLANNYMEEGKLEAAEKYYLLAIKKGHSDAMLNLAILYEKQVKMEAAEKYYLLAIEKGNASAMFNLANNYANEGKFEAAEKYYLLAIEKDDTDAMFNLAILYEKELKPEAAEKYYLLAIQKDDTDAIYNLAILYEKQEKLEAAEKYYLLAIEKNHTDAIFNLAILYENQEKLEAAEKYYLLAIEKSHHGAMFNLANNYYKEGKIEAAEKYYLLAIEKGHVGAMFNNANNYFKEGKIEAAEKYYLLAIEKGHAGAMNNLAFLYKKNGKLEAAEKYYLLAIEKGHAGAMFNLANNYFDEGKTEEAEKYYLLAIEKGHASAMFNLANSYYKEGETEEAEKYYLLAIEKGQTIAINNLANLYDDQGKFKEAEKYYLLAIENGQTNAMFNLSLLYYKTNKNKITAYELIKKLNEQSHGDEKGIQLQIIIEVWNAMMDGVESKIVSILEKNSFEGLNWFLTELLVQEQINLVYKLFINKKHGEELRSRYTPLYYAVLLLNNKTENNLVLRIPPEIKETVDDIIKTVKERRTFYWA